MCVCVCEGEGECVLFALQVKTAKPHLKQLQQCVQSLSCEPEAPPTAPPTPDAFHWLSRSQAYVTVYLVEGGRGRREGGREEGGWRREGERRNEGGREEQGGREEE